MKAVRKMLNIPINEVFTDGFYKRILSSLRTKKAFGDTTEKTSADFSLIDWTGEIVGMVSAFENDSHEKVIRLLTGKDIAEINIENPYWDYVIQSGSFVKEVKIKSGAPVCVWGDVLVSVEDVGVIEKSMPISSAFKVNFKSSMEVGCCIINPRNICSINGRPAYGVVEVDGKYYYLESGYHSGDSNELVFRQDSEIKRVLHSKISNSINDSEITLKVSKRDIVISDGVRRKRIDINF